MAFDKGWTHDGYNKKTGRPEFVGDEKSDDVISLILGESPTAKLWAELWVWGPDIDGTLSDLANCANISRTSLYKILPTFLKHEWIIPSRYVKGLQYYKLNSKHFIVRDMINLLNNHVQSNVEMELAADKIKEKFYKKKKHSRGVEVKHTRF